MDGVSAIYCKSKNPLTVYVFINKDTKFLQVKELGLIYIRKYLELSIDSFTYRGLMQVDLKNEYMLAKSILFLKLISCVQLIEMPKQCNTKEGKNISKSLSENMFCFSPD